MKPGGAKSIIELISSARAWQANLNLREAAISKNEDLGSVRKIQAEMRVYNFPPYSAEFARYMGADE